MRPAFVRHSLIPLFLAALPGGLHAPETVLSACALRDAPVAEWTMPGRLRELSGLARLGPGELLAHNDERARITVLDERTGAPLRTFDLRGEPRDDVEGIAVGEGNIFLMTSTGRIYVTRSGKDGEKVPFTVVETGLGKLCELEGLAWDATTRSLILPCKRPLAPELRGQLTLFLVPAAGGDPTRMNVPLDGLARRTGRRAIEPTAVEVDERTGNVLVLSSGPKVVVEVSREGTIVDAVELRGKGHRQPESIAILPDALLIGDEGDGSEGRITVYGCSR